MAASFTPHPTLSKDSNPKDWAYLLGNLPQDAAVVFTKASLISFLKTHNVEVSTNFSEIRALPKYATVGKMSSSSTGVDTSESSASAAAASFDAPRAAPAAPVPAAAAAANVVRDASGDVFRPTRRVREAVGGGSSGVTAALFGGGDDDAERDAARESARRRGLLLEQENLQQAERGQQPRADETPKQPTQTQQQRLEEEQKARAAQAGFRPTRRVREAVGGGSEQVQALFGGGD